MEYLICEKFGWTINELNDQPYQKVTKFVQIMNVRSRMEQMQAAKAQG